MARSFFGLGVFSLLTLSSSIALAVPATVDTIKGVVEKQESSSAEWSRITPGEKLSDGDSVRTSDNSEADLSTPRGHHFHLSSETTLAIVHLTDIATLTRLAPNLQMTEEEWDNRLKRKAFLPIMLCTKKCEAARRKMLFNRRIPARARTSHIPRKTFKNG